MPDRDDPGEGAKGAIGSGAFSAIVLAIGLVLFALPIPELKQLKLIRHAVQGPAPIAIVGPSVIDTVSRCDSDPRTIPDMLAAEMHRPVSDLSDPGQPISDEINLAAAAGRNRAVKDVILPIAPAAVDEWTTPSYRRLATYQAVSPRFTAFRAASLADFWSGLSLSPQRAQRSFSFAGRAYPDYRMISATEFAREKRLAACPEIATHHPEFTKSYYWWMYVAARSNPALSRIVGDLGGYLADRGQRLHVVLLPVNQDMLRRLSPDWAAVATTRQRQIAAALRARNVHVVDLSTLLSGREFITPWCACTHLSDRGRQRVAQAIAADIQPGGRPQTVAMTDRAMRDGI
jgi:hypothetical protein